MHRLVGALALLLVPFTGAMSADQPSQAPATKSEYIYLLHLVPRLYDPQAWTAADGAAVEAHFKRLEAATSAGKVLIAGRSKEPNDKTFGIVVFEAPSDADAKRFVDSDPCVVHGVMTAELHPFAVALLRGTKANGS